MTESLKSNPSISLIDNKSGSNAVGVGNFKGIMLCNRPFAGTQGKANTTKSGDPASFTCGVVPEAIGQTVLPSSKEKYKIFRSKKDSVLSKHRRWLAELQKTKDTLEARYVDELNRKEEVKRNFIEHEAKLRAATRTIAAAAKEGASGDEGSTADSKSPSAASAGAGRPESTSPVHDNNNKISAKAQPKSRSKKPKWAMSEKEASAAEGKGDGSGDNDLDLDGDESALLEFAESLSFDKFMGDIEVKSIVEKLKKRITELERDVAQEGQRTADAEERAMKREMLAAMGEAAQLIESNDDKDSEAELAAAAKELLQGDEEMQNVHSSKSVTAMMKAARDKIVDEKGKGQVKPSFAANEPLIVVHDPSEGTRLEAKNAVSNLPYMHRNPAV